jgi:hypothetical protein
MGFLGILSILWLFAVLVVLAGISDEIRNVVIELRNLRHQRD